MVPDGKRKLPYPARALSPLCCRDGRVGIREGATGKGRRVEEPESGKIGKALSILAPLPMGTNSTEVGMAAISCSFGSTCIANTDQFGIEERHSDVS